MEVDGTIQTTERSSNQSVRISGYKVLWDFHTVTFTSVVVCTVSVKSLVSQHVIVFIIVGCRLQSGVTLFCCSRFVVTDIACISKSFVWHCYQSCLTTSCCSTVSLLLELLSVKFGYFSISCLSKCRLCH